MSNKLIRTLPALATLTVGAASFALSYVALSEVSAEVGAVAPHLSWLVPIVIDGGIIAGSAVIWDQSRSGGRRQVFPFLFVAALVIVSVIVNINHAAENLLAQGIAALPPLVLLGSIELVAASHRRRHLNAAITRNTVPSAAATAQPAPAAAAQGRDEPSPGTGSDAGEKPRKATASKPASAPKPSATKPAPRKSVVAAASAGDLDPQADLLPVDELLTPLLAEVDESVAVKEAVIDVFRRYVEAGGDPHDKKVTGLLATHFESTSGYVANVIRPLRAEAAATVTS